LVPVASNETSEMWGTSLSSASTSCLAFPAVPHCQHSQRAVCHADLRRPLLLVPFKYLRRICEQELLSVHQPHGAIMDRAQAHSKQTDCHVAPCQNRASEAPHSRSTSHRPAATPLPRAAPAMGSRSIRLKSPARSSSSPRMTPSTSVARCARRPRRLGSIPIRLHPQFGNPSARLRHTRPPRLPHCPPHGQCTPSHLYQLWHLALDSGQTQLLHFGVQSFKGFVYQLLTVAGSQLVSKTSGRPLLISGRMVSNGEAITVPGRPEPGVDAPLVSVGAKKRKARHSAIAYFG
jgi:hypothetical protein